MVLSGCAAHKLHRPTERHATIPHRVATRAKRWLGKGYTVLQLCPQQSEVYVLVGKTGPLKALGHVHAIAVKHLRGFAGFKAHQARAILDFPVAGLVVDPPALRSSLGGIYSKPLDRSARAGTRRHMLSAAVLDAARYPNVQVAVTAHHLRGDRIPILITVDLHGERRKILAHAQVRLSKSDLIAEGRFTIKQTDFHIHPYSILLGALRIKNVLKIHYHLYFSLWLPRKESTNRC